MKGIYRLIINEKSYIGQDSYLYQNQRVNQHKKLLEKGEHFNRKMQEEYDKVGELKFEIEEYSSDFTKDDLNQLEREYIAEYDTFNSDKGFNQTKGGIGMEGFKQSEKSRVKRSEAVRGENNPQSKITNKEFFEIVDFLQKGYTNTEIAKMYKLHDRYVSLIRHKRRHKTLWKQVENYTPEKSTGSQRKRKITFEQFLGIVQMIEEGKTNAEIERKFNLSSGTGSRIRHKKYYKDFWGKVE